MKLDLQPGPAPMRTPNAVPAPNAAPAPNAVPEPNAAPAPNAAPEPNAAPAASAVPSTPKAPNAEDRSTTFRPVEGGNQMQSGEKLLVEAYAAIWVILFALVLMSWRRQRRLDERMNGLEVAIDKAREDEASSSMRSRAAPNPAPAEAAPKGGS